MNFLRLIICCLVTVSSLYPSQMSPEIAQPRTATQEVPPQPAQSPVSRQVNQSTSLHTAPSKAVMSKAVATGQKQVSLGAFDQSLAKAAEPLPPVKLAAPTAVDLQKAILFKGVQEAGISKNTFLCQGSQFSGSSCSQAHIDNAINFDLSGGKTLQFLDNFVYWLQAKDKRRQYIKTDLRYDGSALTSKLQQEGWGATSPYCLLVSTNPMLQKVVLPGQPAPKGSVKVIAQLLYSGSNLIELWSQDVVFVKEGESISLSVSNAADERLPAMLAESKKATGVVNFLEELGLQSNTREEQTYAMASDSPRMVRIEVVPTQQPVASVATSSVMNRAALERQSVAQQKPVATQAVRAKQPVQTKASAPAVQTVAKVR